MDLPLPLLDAPEPPHSCVRQVLQNGLGEVVTVVIMCVP